MQLTDEFRKFRSAIEEQVDQALTEDALAGVRKRISDVFSDLQSDFEYHLRNDAAYNLGLFVQQMAEDAIKAMLAGDEDAMRRYLQCEPGHYTGRDRDHLVIHNQLFETGAVALRKSIVDAHPEFLKTERILDLEDQVASLVKQVNRLNARCEELLRERVCS